MLRLFWLMPFALTLLGANPLEAQAQKDSVLAAVDRFFTTMTNADSAGGAAVLSADGVAHALVYAADSVSIRTSPHARYIAAMGRTPGRVERIWNPTVLIHKDLATVWSPYDFHIDGRFSHCGVDSFLLLRERGVWRVFSIAYTVERTGCAPSPLGPLKTPPSNPNP